MATDYNEIRRQNGARNAVNQAVADITIAGLEYQIREYKDGMLTAQEFLDYLVESAEIVK